MNITVQMIGPALVSANIDDVIFRVLWDNVWLFTVFPDFIVELSQMYIVHGWSIFAI